MEIDHPLLLKHCFSSSRQKGKLEKIEPISIFHLVMGTNVASNICK